MARRRLQILGQPLDLDVTLETKTPPAVGSDGQQPNIAALFEAAAMISGSVSEIVRGRERAAGRSVSCKEACAACCHHLIPISAVEAVLLAKTIASLPLTQRHAVTKRFEQAVQRMEKGGLLEPGATGRAALRSPALKDGESSWDATSRRYRELSIPCPLLEQQRCSVYAQRPLVCREYAVTSPRERCAHPRSEGVVAVIRPVRMSEVLADTVTAASSPGSAPIASIPLALTLEWAIHHGASLTLEADPDTLARTLLDLVEVEEEEEATDV